MLWGVSFLRMETFLRTRLKSAEYRQEEGCAHETILELGGSKLPCRGQEAPQSAAGYYMAKLSASRRRVNWIAMAELSAQLSFGPNSSS